MRNEKRIKKNLKQKKNKKNDLRIGIKKRIKIRTGKAVVSQKMRPYAN